MKKKLTMALLVALAGNTVPALAYQQGDWGVRLGPTTVDPDTDSDTIDLNFLQPGVEAVVRAKDDTQLGLIPFYMVTDKLAVEVLAATPFDHDMRAHGQGAASGVRIDAGSTKHLPPTVSLQWHPRGGQEGWQPYLGIGLNYTYFFDEDVDGELISLLGSLTGGAVNDADLDVDDSWGLAAQAGVDFPISDNLAVNIGLWYIDIDTRAEITAKVDGATAAKVAFDVELDPWVYNVGIAYKF